MICLSVAYFTALIVAAECAISKSVELIVTVNELFPSQLTTNAVNIPPQLIDTCSAVRHMLVGYVSHSRKAKRY